MGINTSSDCLEGVAGAIRQFEQGSTWIERRDAADALALAAREILLAVRGGAIDADPDVSHACKQALAHIQSDLTSDLAGLEAELAQKKRTFALEREAARPSADAGPTASDIQKWLKQVAAANRGEIETSGGHATITLAMAGGRHQKVHVDLEQTDSGGQRLVFMYTLCGATPASSYGKALESNASLSHAAFAILKQGEKETLILVCRRPMADMTERALANSLLYLANKGDRVESQLRSDDQY